jgi:hypothetical protein
MTRQLKYTGRHARQSLAFAAGLACTAGALAQDAAPNPYYIGVSQAFTHESNLFRQTTGEVSDTLSSTSLYGGVDQPFGRQRFYANGSASANRYQDTSRLNNTGYGLNVGLDWSTIEHLSGNLRYSANQNLADYGAVGVAGTTTSKSIERSQLLLASARYGITSRMALEAGVQRREVDYSDAAFASRDNTQNAVNAGVTYGVSGFLTFGAGGRYTTTRRPNLAGGPDKANRRDLDLTTNWSPTGLSTLSARLSFSNEDHSQPALEDFSGVTGSLEWLYRPTGKLRFRTTLSRDTGTESRFIGYTGGTQSPATESYRLTTAARLGIAYDITAKVQLNASVRHARGTITSGGVEGSDKTTESALSVSYAVARNISLACDVSRETRSSATALSTAYSANTAGCSAQFTYR